MTKTALTLIIEYDETKKDLQELCIKMIKAIMNEATVEIGPFKPKQEENQL